jgi:hypothetical protein
MTIVSSTPSNGVDESHGEDGNPCNVAAKEAPGIRLHAAVPNSPYTALTIGQQAAGQVS